MCLNNARGRVTVLPLLLEVGQFWETLHTQIRGTGTVALIAYKYNAFERDMGSYFIPESIFFYDVKHVKNLMHNICHY